MHGDGSIRNVMMNPAGLPGVTPTARTGGQIAASPITRRGPGNLRTTPEKRRPIHNGVAETGNLIPARRRMTTDISIGGKGVRKRDAWTLGFILVLTACSSGERRVLDATTNGADPGSIERTVEAQAQNLLAPLTPPEPGTPGGLPADKTPLAEGPIAPDSPQGAGQVVQRYFGLLEARRFADAQKLWDKASDHGTEAPDVFAAHFAGFSEVHANIGTPGDAEGAAGSTYVTVPVQVYARVAATGKPWYDLRAVTLRRVNDGEGSGEDDRSWHIESIGPYTPPAPAAKAAPQP